MRRNRSTLDFDWLTDGLAVGGSLPPDSAMRLARTHEITRVVDLRSEMCDDEAALKRQGIRLLRLPTPDTCAVARAKLETGVAWVAKALSAGRRVLVHCQHGIGRSALLAMCVLVDAGMPPLEAMLLAKNAREIVSPSPDQLRAFIGFVGRRRRLATPWIVPSFDALAAIAYRHLQRPGRAAGAR
jgi:protein-tyrosine phosphatase